MKMLAIHALLAGAIGLFGSYAGATILPAEVRASLPAAELAGRAKLTVWGFEVYNATLWVAPGFSARDYARHGFALELAYLRDLSAEAIAKRSISEMRRQGATAQGKESAWERQMHDLFPDIKTGDRITGVHRPGVGALFLVNDQPRGEIRDAEFARLFFGIWLSPMTSEPKMRQELLALTRP